jgi:hypothetical protein
MKSLFCSCLLLAAVCSGPLVAVSSAQLTYGDPTSVGDGWIRTYVQLNAGLPERVGVLFDRAALTTFAASPSSVTLLSLPASAPAPFNHVMVDWNAAGHPGPGYEVPHFDFHFYFSTPAEVDAIPFSPAPAPIEPAYVAPGYIPDLVVVPQMGWHYLDSQSPEFADPTAFTETFIYGYHGGKMTFLEPMIALDFLETGGDHLLPVRQPPQVQTAGYYPTDYGYSSEAGLYDVFLGGLNFRTAVAVPEPATWGMWAAILLGVMIGWRRFRRPAVGSA